MQPSVRKKSWMNRFIDTIEYWGNKLPHPFILFGMLVVITLIGSWILSQAGCSITYMAASRTPGEPEKEVTIAVTNLLSGENLRYLITKYPDIFISLTENCYCSLRSQQLGQNPFLITFGTSIQRAGPNPVPSNLCAILQAEKQFVRPLHRDGFHFIREDILIKFRDAKHRRTGFHEFRF